MTTFRPSPDQELLLRVALADGDDDAIGAWRELRPRFDLDALPPGYFALLPLVYRTLTRLDTSDELLPRLKGIYRSTWTKNNLLLERARTTSRALDQSGVRALLVGGAASALRFYEEVGLRPTLVVEWLVEPRAAAVATDLVRDNATLVRTSLAADIVDDVFADLYDTAIELDVRGTTVRALSPTDELLALCVRHARATTVTLTQWLADSALIVRSGSVDWERLSERAQTYRQALRVRDALAYVDTLPGVAVPPEALERLARARVSRRERTLYALTSGKIRGFGDLPATVGEHLVAGGSVRGLAPYLRDRWQLEHGWQLPLAAGRRAVRVVRGRSA